MKRVFTNIGLSVGSVVVFFGLFELMVRLVGPDLSLPQAEQQFQFTQSFEFELPHHARDPELGWRLTPGTYGPMTINSSGFRGRDPHHPDPVGTRIAHLGDSCTMGFSVPSDRGIYSAKLEMLLKKDGLDAQTFNFGVDGYSSHQGRILLDEVLFSLRPEFVTLYFGYNDHHWSNASDRNTVWADGGKRSALEHSDAYRWMRRTIFKMMGREARLVEPQRRVSVGEFEENLRSMIRAARQASTTPILLTTPLRVGPPLHENEVLATLNGEPRWVTQEWWIKDKMRAAGLELNPGGTPRHQGVLQGIIDAYPEWPLPHFLMARELQAAGDSAGMRRQLQLAQQYDAERRVMGEYNEAVRGVAAELQVPLVDLAAEFPVRQRVFNDVVHPNEAGHTIIATELAKKIHELQQN